MFNIFREFFGGVPIHCNKPMMIINRYKRGENNYILYKCQKCPCTIEKKEKLN